MHVLHFASALLLAAAAVSAALATEVPSDDKTVWDLYYAKHPERYTKLVDNFAKALNADEQGRITTDGFGKSFQAAKSARMVPDDVQSAEYFNLIDTNKDGYVNRGEVDGFLRERMQATRIGDIVKRQKELNAQKDNEYKPAKLTQKILVRHRSTVYAHTHSFYTDSGAPGTVPQSASVTYGVGACRSRL